MERIRGKKQAKIGQDELSDQAKGTHLIDAEWNKLINLFEFLWTNHLCERIQLFLYWRQFRIGRLFLYPAKMESETMRQMIDIFI